MSPMHLAELTVRLAATTLFSPVDRAQLRALPDRSPRRRAQAGEWIADLPLGLHHHLVLLGGAVRTLRSWTDADGAEQTSSRRVEVAADGPGFALLGAGGKGLRVQALADTEYLAVDTDDLDDLLGWSFLGAFVLPEPHLKLFHSLPLETVARAIDRLVERAVASGETIVRQGEPGDSFYVILDGEAEVWAADAADGVPRLVNSLADGDSFGEEALLAQSSRTATVTMTTPGRLLVLGKADFDALLRPPMVEEIAAPAARDMLARREARLLDCRQPVEHAASHIAGARSLPLDGLRHDGVFSLDPDATYIVYCDTGRRSRAAAFLLYERGIRALSLVGGLTRWPFALEGTSV
ncbi:MAG TPA: cyclic nucleotide-binding domain-containing protein [Rubrivivax sp.]|nr:cyclic nucleotide-binding domain-containing protein [Rubrivivax sp.]